MSVEAISNEAQSDEYEALLSIYAENFHIVEADNKVYSICVVDEQDTENGDHTITLQFQHVPGYPDRERLKYNIHAPWLSSPNYDNLMRQLDSIVEGSMELPVVHVMVETIRSFMEQELRNRPMKQQEEQTQPANGVPASDQAVIGRAEASNSVPTVRYHLNALPNLLPMAVGNIVDIFHGDPIIDRKSVFQAHCARVTTVGQVSWFISTLLSDRRVASATHNILAWRLLLTAGGSNLLTDCDDDGENQAGGRLLHLLTLADARNVVVMVTRWYGGIQLGPDRFKHINNVARQLLSAQGMLSSASATNPSSKKTKRSRRVNL